MNVIPLTPEGSQPAQSRAHNRHIAQDLNMSSTCLSLHYHLVFGTKNREPLIAPEWRSRLHEYLGIEYDPKYLD
jgi:hypothetical protein